MFFLFSVYKVVWKASTQVAVATAASQKKNAIFVARYSPRGNFGNKQAYIENVTPPGKLLIGNQSPW